MNDLVSIIVPVYKTEKFLPKCIKSVLSQTYKNWELILVDDGSPDRCGEICDQYAYEDHRIKVIHQTNMGVNLARKNGFLKSIGEWIMFVDYDDSLRSNAIEVLLKNSYEMDIVSGVPVILKDESSEPENFPKHIQEFGVYDCSGFLTMLFEAKRLCAIWRQLINRKVLSEEILSISPQVKFSEDFIINFRIGLNVSRVKGIHDIVYDYNYYQGNSVTSFHMTREYFDLYFTELLKGIPNDKKVVIDKLLYNYFLNTILRYIGVKDIDKSQVASYLRADRKKYKLRLKSRYVLLLLYVPSCKIRSSLLGMYYSLAKFIAKMN